MPDRIPAFEPEVEQILREVASNPNSYLLREPQRKGAIAPLDLEEGVSLRTAGLTIPEKHLLQVWREEAAELLRQGFNASLERGQSFRTVVVHLDLRSRRVESPSAEFIRRRAASLSRTAQVGGKPSLAEALVALRVGQSIDEGLQRRLIRLSYRIRPTDASRVCLAQFEAEQGRWQRSLNLYRWILSRSSSTDARAYALSNIASIYIELQDPQKRLEAAQLCVQLAPRWAFSHQKLLRSLADQGRTSDARDCLADILNLGSGAVSLLREHLEWMKTRSLALRSESESGETERHASFARVAGELAEHAPAELSELLAFLATVE